MLEGGCRACVSKLHGKGLLKQWGCPASLDHSMRFCRSSYVHANLCYEHIEYHCMLEGNCQACIGKLAYKGVLRHWGCRSWAHASLFCAVRAANSVVLPWALAERPQKLRPPPPTTSKLVRLYTCGAPRRICSAADYLKERWAEVTKRNPKTPAFLKRLVATTMVAETYLRRFLARFAKQHPSFSPKDMRALDLINLNGLVQNMTTVMLDTAHRAS